MNRIHTFRRCMMSQPKLLVYALMVGSLGWVPRAYATDCASTCTGPCRHCEGETCVNDTGGCNDGNDCTVNDQCSGGLCTGSPKCTTNGCRQASCTAGTCTYTSTCGTSNKCNDVICRNNACTTTPKCDDGINCTEDICDSSTGVCSHPQKCNVSGCMKCSDPCATCDANNHCQPNGCSSSCCKDDPKNCISRRCVNGECKSTSSCGTGTGCPACDDGNDCTKNDCVNGVCEFPPLCPPNDPPTNDCYENSCAKNPGTGNYECVQKWLCEDYDDCTDDSCVDGKCVHKVRCTGSCPSTGCSDKDPCTENDQCVNGYCQGTPKVCTPANNCQTSLGCNPSTGNCDFQPVTCPTCKECDMATGQCVTKSCPGQCCQNGNCVAACSTAACFKPDCPANGICESNCKPEDCETCDGQGTCEVCNGDTCKECVTSTVNGQTVHECKTKSQSCESTITNLAICNTTGASGSLTATITNTGTCEDTFFWKLMVKTNGAALGWPNNQRVASGSVTLDPNETITPAINITITPEADAPGGQADLEFSVCNSRNTLNSPDCGVCPDCTSGGACTTKTATVTFVAITLTRSRARVSRRDTAVTQQETTSTITVATVPPGQENNVGLIIEEGLGNGTITQTSSTQWVYTSWDEDMYDQHPQTKDIHLQSRLNGDPCAAIMVRVMPVFMYLTGPDVVTLAPGTAGAGAQYQRAYDFLWVKYSGCLIIAGAGFSGVTLADTVAVPCDGQQAKACTQVTDTVTFGISSWVAGENVGASTIGHELAHTPGILNQSECIAYTWEVDHSACTGLQGIDLQEAQGLQQCCCNGVCPAGVVCP